MILSKKLIKALVAYIMMISIIKFSLLSVDLIPEFDECETCEEQSNISLTQSFVEGVQEEQFITYLPHSQFHNQIIELKNAIVLAYLTNRTLIMPPILRYNQSKLSIPHSALYGLYDRL